ncbi:MULTISPECIES: hypothetical protein [unclassified Paenibacillus]|uniref:hypothetical protein n=1 Tax=unclassified Paenibacillus TaxID=185978 RepID=UPI00041720A6|nr:MULTISPECIES: hypothetical protein [unclassified Paenibacillus]KGP80079.1 hypothetical protein P364_0122010 [Paenibacillus sp. MAEPY2]KGP89420.1 hypothetical protein P363_0100280 [Paenibacillus sp. MAEPY1]
MYPISPLYTDYLRRPDREFIVKALVQSEEYDSSKIVDFSIENSLSLNDGFEIGTAIPSKLTIRLRTNEIIPANARIVPYLSLSMAGMTWLQAQYPWQDMHVSWTGDGTDWLPLGEFFVDGRERVNDVWTFTCYDKLVFADVAYISSLTYPTTQRAVFNEICNRLGWTYDSSVVINPAYQIQAGPAGYSMRQVLSYIASANSASIYIDKAGTVKFKRFTAADTPVFDMTTADYVQVKQTNPVKTYTRVVVTYNIEDELQYEAGTGDDNHTLYVENPFATQAVTNGLLAALNGFSYLPLTMDARGFPQLEQGDVIGFEQQEGTTWDETVSTWQDTHIPWDGIMRYKTVILHQVFNFAGGLRMTLEAPSVSEQQSEFVVDGTLTTAVNKLNKEAVKEGKSYYGATITRNEGWIVEREDHLSKAVFNSDELTFYAESDKAIWFDVPSRRYKFNGTLEAVDGVFSGDLKAAGGTFGGTLQGVDGTFEGTVSGGRFVGGSIQIGSSFSVNESGHMVAVGGEFSGTISAAVINGVQINGSTIIGSVLKTSESGRRIEIDQAGWRSIDASNRKRVSIGYNDAAGMAGLTFFSESEALMGQLYASSGSFSLIGQNDMLIRAMNGTLSMQGAIDFSFATVQGLGISKIAGLQTEINSLWTGLNGKASTSHTHSQYAVSMAYDAATKNLKLYNQSGSVIATVNLA